jgi:hypothetical protein
MKKQLLFPLILITGLSTGAFAQTAGDYRSNAASFNWNVDASWQRWNGTAWVVPTAAQGYPGETAAGVAGTVTIQAGHTVTANVDVVANDIGNLIIAGTLVENNNNYNIEMTGNLNITGTFDINGDNCTVDVGGNLNISGSGILNLDDNDIRVGIIGSFDIAGSGAFNLNDDDLTVNIGNNLSVQGNGTLNMNGNGDDQDINVAGNLTMMGTSQILGDDSNSDIDVVGTFTVPASGTNVRIGGVNLNIDGNTVVAGTLTLNDDDGVKTFSGTVTVPGTWTSTAITTEGRLVFKSEVLTSGTFTPGCN